MIIFWQPIDEKKLSQIIEFCFFSAFKKNEIKNQIIEKFKKNLQKNVNIEITPIKINPWGRLLRWAGENFNSGINKRIDKLKS